MKILWLCSWYPHPGNPYEGDFIQRHAKALSAFAELDVFYVIQDGIDHEVVEENIIHQTNGKINETIALFKFHRTGFRLWDKMRYNLSYLSTYKKLVRAHIRKKGVPDIVHVHIPLKAGMLGRWIKRKWNIPYILSEHSSHYDDKADDKFSSKSSLYKKRVQMVFSDAALVTNVSHAVGAKLKDIFGLKEVSVIRNTVDTSLFFYQPAANSKFRFIHVSTLAEYQKNISGMIRAIKILSGQRQDFELVIVGPVNDQLRKQVSERGLDELVSFTGEISYPEVAWQMQQASALLLFSRFENFPCVIIEALCCGVPVVASDTGGVREAINPGNGILVPNEDEASLLEALKRMIAEKDKYDRQELARCARVLYSYEAIGLDFYELYKQFQNNRSSS